MLNRFFLRTTIAAALFILGPVSASATIFTGDPLLDGWLAGGRSFIVGPDPGFPDGAYVGGIPGDPPVLPFVNYQVFSHNTIIDAPFRISLLAVCPVVCSTWIVGDTIIGLGAVFPATGSNQNSPATLAVKWGVTSSVYSLSTLNLGNGNRNHDTGDGGVGSVLATLDYPSVGSAPTTAFQRTATQNLILGGQYIAFSSVIVGGEFRSFQAYLNVTRLNADNPNAIAPLPIFGGNSIVAVRNYNFGNLQQETNALVNGVPEPATGLLAAGAFLAGWIVRRRQPATGQRPTV